MIDVSKEEALQLLRVMYAIRAFELRMQAIFRKRTEAGQSVGALHSCEGQEAVAAGVAPACGGTTTSSAPIAATATPSPRGST